MASRKNRNIYIPKYFMEVRKCIIMFVIYGLEVRLC